MSKYKWLLTIISVIIGATIASLGIALANIEYNVYSKAVIVIVALLAGAWAYWMWGKK